MKCCAVATHQNPCGGVTPSTEVCSTTFSFNIEVGTSIGIIFFGTIYTDFYCIQPISFLATSLNLCQGHIDISIIVSHTYLFWNGYQFSVQVVTNTVTVGEGEEGVISVTSNVPPALLCNSTVSSFDGVYLQASINRAVRDYHCSSTRYPNCIIVHKWRLWHQKHIFMVWIRKYQDYIPQHTVGCNYLSRP